MPCRSNYIGHWLELDYQIIIGGKMVKEYNNIKVEIGTKIKMYRKIKLKVSREEFTVDVTDKFCSIENIECGRSMPEIGFMVNLSNKYGEPVSAFIDTGFRHKDEIYRQYPVEGADDLIKLKIMQQVNIEKYCRLRGKPMEDFVSPDIKNGFLYENMGRLIHNERVKKGLGSYKLAESIGMTRKSILNLEKANNRMSMYTLYRICSILRVPLDYILVDGLKNKETAIKYLIADTFWDVNEKEKNYLVKYMQIVSEFYKK